QDVFAGWPFFGPPFFGHAKKGGSPAREGGEKRLGRRPDSTSISAASLECAFALQFAPRWEDAGCFKPAGEGAPYSILLPPPNVTGTLHMGHAFQQTIMDALIRHAR